MRPAPGSTSPTAKIASASSPASTNACSTRCWTFATTSSSTTRRMLSSLDAAAMGDRVWIGFEDTAGAERQVFFSASGAGLGPRRAAHRDSRIRPTGRRRGAAHHGVRGTTDQAEGYRAASSRMAIASAHPLRCSARGLACSSTTANERGAVAQSYGTLRGDDLHTQGPTDRGLPGAGSLPRAVHRPSARPAPRRRRPRMARSSPWPTASTLATSQYGRGRAALS